MNFVGRSGLSGFAPALLLISLLVCAPQFVCAQAQPIFTTCSTSDAHGAVYLQARVNDRATARLFFDTGSITFLSDVFVKSSGLRTQPVVGKDGAPERFPDGRPVMAAHVAMAIP